ncbi:MAG: hypothetical protein ACYTF1_04935 [Planctomycetota bacterium]|jgi:hypothetical protein
MFSRLGKIVLWKYADDTPIERLYRHHRIARTIVYIWIASGILMVTMTVDFMFSKGWWQQIAMVIIIVAGCIALLSSIPGIICIFWASEIEETLKSRGYSIPTKKPIGELIGSYAMKMCYWFIVFVLGVQLFK